MAYLKALHSLVTYLGISDNMAEGSMRCDINISLREKGSDALGTHRDQERQFVPFRAGHSR